MRRIPPHLLHITLDDLPADVRSRLVTLLADLPQLPTHADSAVLAGPSTVTLPALAVLARHVIQGLRDHNLTLAHDRPRLRRDRRKLLFWDASTLLEDGPTSESVLCLAGATPEVLARLQQREAAGLATFVTTSIPLDALAHWRHINLQSTASLPPSKI
jgi:hypothetical protein